MSEKAEIHPVRVGYIHDYTRSTAPWLLEAYGKKLFRYLSGGGISALGRSVKQEEVDIRRNRFLAVSAVIGVVWLVLLVA